MGHFDGMARREQSRLVIILVAPVLSGHVSPMMNLGTVLGHVPGHVLGVLKMSSKIHGLSCFNRGHRTPGRDTLRTQYLAYTVGISMLPFMVVSILE